MPPARRLAASAAVVALTLTACATDPIEDAMPEDTEATARTDERRTIHVGAGTSAPAGELRVRVVLAGASGADLVVERGGDRAEVSVDVGEASEVLGHRIEVVDADGDGATLAITDPSGRPVDG